MRRQEGRGGRIVGEEERGEEGMQWGGRKAEGDEMRC